MKILIVINDYLNNSNGMCISTQRFVKQFRENGHEVRIITNNRYGQLDYPLDVLRIPVFAPIIEKEGYTFAKVDKKTIRKAIKWADVVHIEDPFFVCHQAAIEAKRQNKPLTGTFHMYPENMTYNVHVGNAHFLNYELMRFFLKSVYNHLDYVQCPTEEVMKRLEKFNIKAKCQVISNGIDDFYLCDSKKHQFDGKNMNILTVGRLSTEKRQATILKALSLSKHKDQIKLTIAGKGPLEKQIIALANEYGINHSISFMNKEQLKKTMLESDIYVHCANIEVEGMSCMESFGCGCVPIIGNAKLSSTKKYALTDINSFDYRNYKELAEKIDYLFENPDILNDLSKQYIDYSKTLTIENSAKKLLEMMETAIREKENV